MDDSQPEGRPDPSLESPEPHPWRSLSTGDDDRTLHVHYVRGLWQGLHSVGVDIGPDEIHITILLGLTREHVERAARGEEFGYALMGIEEWTRIMLPEPVGGRRIVGSVEDEPPGGSERNMKDSDP